MILQYKVLTEKKCSTHQIVTTHKITASKENSSLQNTSVCITTKCTHSKEKTIVYNAYQQTLLYVPVKHVSLQHNNKRKIA